MTTKIHIVECQGLLKIVKSDDLKNGCIRIRHYDDYEDSYYDEMVPVIIKQSFLVITNGQFIRNDSDTSKLNACTMSGGFGQINRLAYSYSVVVMTYTGHGKVWESDVIYSDAGVKSTQFDMYSYHVNDPEQKYIEWRLDYEVFEFLDLNKIFGKYLSKIDVRDSKIDDLLS